MKYIIIFDDGDCVRYNGTDALKQHLKLHSRQDISDIRKIRTNGNSETVMDIYGRHMLNHEGIMETVQPDT